MRCMGTENLLSKVKHLIYKIIKPIYLWSVNQKTLDSYISSLEKEYFNLVVNPKIKDWRRGMSMTCKEVDILDKANTQILKVLNEI